MRLFCELGWHKADPVAPWNNGYYFSKCRRCRRDLVRAAFGGWKVPKGYRVVWRAASPEETVPASLAAAPAASLPFARRRRLPDIAGVIRRWNLSGHTDAASAQPEDKLPIQEVLRHADAHSPVTASAMAHHPGSTVYLDDDWGFGEEERSAPAANPAAIEPKPQPAPEPEPEVAEALPPEPVGEPPINEPEPVETAAAAVEEASTIEAPQAAAPPAPEPAAEPFQPEERFPWEVGDEEDERANGKRSSARARALTAGAVLVGITALAVALSTNRTSLSNDATDAPPFDEVAQIADPAPVPTTGEESAIVTASIINCRSAPSEAAPVVRKMVRTLRVQVLARQPEWTLVAYRGRQCWLAAQYLVSEVPMQAQPR